MRPRSLAPFLTVTILLAQRGDQPLIRVTTRLVEVNVIVRGKNGPVTGLTRDDFTILDKGKEQTIAAFSVTSAHLPPSAAPEPLPANVFTNRVEYRSAAAPPNVTVVLLDGVNTQIQDQQYAKRQFLKFLSQLQSGDRVAVYALGARLRVLQDFTSDSKALVQALKKHSGDNLAAVDASTPERADTQDEDLNAMLNEAAGVVADMAIENRARTTAAALEAIAGHIARVPGHKSLIWISGSFPFSIGHAGADGPANWEDAAFDQRLAGGSSRGSTGGPATGSLSNVNLHDGNPARDQVRFNQEIGRATRALNDGNIAVYPVDARGLIVLPKSMTAAAGPVSRQSINTLPVQTSFIPVGHSSMMAIADATGGRVFENSNDITGAIRTAIDDAEVTYTLGFYPDSKTLDGKFHDLKVLVRRKDAELRYRRTYLASAETSSTDEQRSAQIRDAIWSPLESTGIALTAALEKVEASRLRVTVAIEPKDLALRPIKDRWIGQIDFAYAQRAADGRDLKNDRQSLGINLDQPKYEQLMQQGFTLTKTIDPAAGLAQVRFVIVDKESGRTGSLIIPVK
jgi:VWFA-related protein